MVRLGRKINTFLRLPRSTRRLFAEALLTSAWVKMSLLFFPFKRVLGWMGMAHTESDYTPDDSSLIDRRSIKSALQLCHKYAFWPTECYTLALTGKLLLKRRNISSTLYIGFMKDPQGKFKGHAWLRAGDTYITGYRESAGFQVNLIFT